MNLNKLIETVGVDNIEVQSVHQSLLYANEHAEGGVEIALLTDAVSMPEVESDSYKKTGIILWFDTVLLPSE